MADLAGLLRECLPVLKNDLRRRESILENPDSDLYDDGGLYHDVQEIKDLVRRVEEVLGQ